LDLNKDFLQLVSNYAIMTGQTISSRKDDAVESIGKLKKNRKTILRNTAHPQSRNLLQKESFLLV